MADKRTTVYPGVRYRQHPTRKHGLRFDRYFSIYFRLPDTENPGKTRKIEEGLGWSSQGWTAEKALEELTKLKTARRTGEGPLTLQEKREIKAKVAAEEAARRVQEEKDSLTFSQAFSRYFAATEGEKAKGSRRREEQLHRRWIAPILGQIPVKDVHREQIQVIRDMMISEGKAPRTAEYCLAVIRQVFNYCRNVTPPLYTGENPVSSIKKPKLDNRRVRYLTHDECDALLAALSQRSKDAHDIALLSLRAGLRAGEVFRLSWPDVDFSRNMLFIKDTKSGRNRFVPMADDIKKMLTERRTDSKGFIFLARSKKIDEEKKIETVSRSFSRAVKELHFNEGITDPRLRVCFHTLRHTYAALLVESGVDLYVVKTLLGHSTLTMTERYAHVGESLLQNAVRALNETVCGGNVVRLPRKKAKG